VSIINPPVFFGLASHQYPANRVRRLIGGLLHNIDGVATPTDLLVTPTAPVSMSVTLTPGAGFVTGTTIAGQGIYMVENDAAVTVGPFASVASGSRIDLVVARIRDGAPDGGADPANTAGFEIIQGIAAATPSWPSIPASCLVLAAVQITAGDTAINAGNITSYRPVVAGAAPSPIVYEPPYAGAVSMGSEASPTPVVFTGGSSAIPLPPGRWHCRARVRVGGPFGHYLIDARRGATVLRRELRLMGSPETTSYIESGVLDVEWVASLATGEAFTVVVWAAAGVSGAVVGATGLTHQLIAQRVV